MPVAPEQPASARAGHEPQPVSEERAAAAPPRSRARSRSTATSGEPQIERVIVKPDHAEGAATEPGVLTSEPTRRGWWQRRLGSE
jgi:hypothetical protein